jgi:hypothetical protein
MNRIDLLQFGFEVLTTVAMKSYVAKDRTLYLL